MVRDEVAKGEVAANRMPTNAKTVDAFSSKNPAIDRLEAQIRTLQEEVRAGSRLGVKHEQLEITMNHELQKIRSRADD